MAEDAHRFRATLEGSTVLRYALAPVCIAVALLLQISVIGSSFPVWSPSPPPIHSTGLFQVSIVGAAWFGGAGPGFLAALLATLVLPQLLTMNYPLIAGFFDLPRFVAFGITGLAVGWGTTFWRRAEAALRRSELELRKARNELETKVVERTAELRRSEALLAEAQKLSQTGSLGWNISTGELFWSEETFRIAGYDLATQPTLERVFQRIHPEDIARVQETLDRGVQTGTDLDFELRFVMPGGSVKHVHVVAQAVRDEKGNLEYVGAVMDITARKAQGELAHVTRVMTMGELAASIAHEVNQPLAAVIANANASLRWLAATTPNLDEAREAVMRVVRDGNRASDVITRIRMLVQKTDPEKARLDIHQTVQEVVILMQNEAVRRGVALHMDLAADVPPVLGDRVQLQQVILNLVMNGVEAMSSVADRPRELLVRSRQEEPDHVLVAVRDTGVGIDRQHLDRIVDPFYTTKSQGMGMGLAIGRSIVEHHGGWLWVVPNDGPGTTFQFTPLKYH